MDTVQASLHLPPHIQTPTAIYVYRAGLIFGVKNLFKYVDGGILAAIQAERANSDASTADAGSSGAAASASASRAAGAAPPGGSLASAFLNTERTDEYTVMDDAIAAAKAAVSAQGGDGDAAASSSSNKDAARSMIDDIASP